MKTTLSPESSEILYWAVACILAHSHEGALEAWAHVEALRNENNANAAVHKDYKACFQLGFATMAASLRIGGVSALNNFLGEVELCLPSEMAESLSILRDYGQRGGFGASSH